MSTSRDRCSVIVGIDDVVAAETAAVAAAASDSSHPANCGSVRRRQMISSAALGVLPAMSLSFFVDAQLR